MGIISCFWFHPPPGAARPQRFRKQTPLETKRKELMDDPRYRTEAAPDTNKTRERRTTAKRRDKEVKPI